MNYDVIPILPSDVEAFQDVMALADRHRLRNIVLLGDLHQPCIEMASIYGIISSDGELKACFVVFHAFPFPSIAFSHDLDPMALQSLFSFLKKKPFQEFWIVNFQGQEFISSLARHFEIVAIHDEQLMVISRTQFNQTVQWMQNDDDDDDKKIAVIKAREEDIPRITAFYERAGTPIWHPIQFKSGFYHYIQQDGEMIACGGTHFETHFSAQLGNIHVLSRFRRKGLGYQLVKAITKDILSKKEMATLFVASDNVPAKSLYRKLGYHFHDDVKIVHLRKKS